MLAEITLDPPTSTQDLAGPPLRDEDWLVLSTIHSAKGLEWDCVCVIHAADGNIPSDMSTGSPEEIEEERRLFYVALTRAKNWLAVCWPLRYYRRSGSFSDSYGYVQLTRFLPEGVREHFEPRTTAPYDEGDESDLPSNLAAEVTSETIRRRTKSLWS
jgi:DNA helicase-2/ATP-dependent DNA helicase PcrA